MSSFGVVLFYALWIAFTDSQAQNAPSGVVTFVNIYASAGIGGIPEYGGHAILFADINGDGHEDMYVTHTNFDPGGGGFLVLPDELFVNNGNSTFTEIGQAASVNDPGQSHGAVFVDIDNDGDFDLFNGQRGPSGNRLYRNLGNGTFEEITEAAGILLEDRRTISVLAIDIENDGDMDLFSGNWGRTNEMYVNDGTGHFTLENRGIEDGDDPEEIGTMGATAADVDNDGDVDIFLAKREDTCRLFINDGTGHFTDQAASRGVAHFGLSAGAVFVDIDRDADLDMLLASLASPTPGDDALTELRIYRNQGNGFFVDVTDGNNIPFSGYTINTGDLNNDGFPDIFLSINYGMSSLWLNDGTGHFVKQNNTGLERNGIDVRATTLADIDNDGDLDVAITHIEEPTILYRNDLNVAATPAQNFLQVVLALPEGNAAPFGTKVHLYQAGHLDDPAYLRGFQQLIPVQGTLSQNSPVLHFGVAPNENYDVRVRYLDGTSRVLTNVAPGQRIHPGAGPDTTAPLISNVIAASLLPTSAAITWSTDEPATSQVEYGLSVNLGTFTPVDTVLSQAHHVDLNALTAGTIYYFTVISIDAANNNARSDTLTFFTPLPDLTPPVINNVTVAELQPGSARIQWSTDEPATSQVEYGLDLAYGSLTPFDPVLVAAHEVSLTGLESSTLYHFRVRSRDAQGNEAISGDFQFTTLAGPLLADDFNGPSLDLDKWVLGNHPGNLSQVENGALHLRSSNPTTGWVHTKNKFSGRNRTIQIKVVQPNDDGALGMSPTVISSATTGFFDEPNWYRFYNYRSNPDGPVKLFVQWRKGGTVDGLDVALGVNFVNDYYLRLRAGETSIFFEYSFDGANWTSAYDEAFSLPGYTLDDFFAFELSAYNTPIKDEWVVDDFAIRSTVSPPNDATPPAIANVEAIEVQITSARIRWMTDESATSQVEYGFDLAYGSLTPLDSSLVTAHEVPLAGLAPDHTYHFRVRSRDSHGNEAVSGDFQFTTSAEVLLADDFNGSSLNLSNWVLASHAENESGVENGALHLRTSGQASGWIHTRGKFRAHNRTIGVKVIQPNGDGALGVSPTADSTAENGFYDELNWYRFYNYREDNSDSYKLFVQWRKNGMVNGLDVALGGYFTSQFYLRMRIDGESIAFEYSYDGTVWITAYSEPFSLPGYSVDDLFFCELSAHNTLRHGEWVVDDFAIQPTGGVLGKSTGHTPESATIPREFALSQNYPNPFNLSTRVTLDLPESGHMQAVVFNLQGQEVARLLEGELTPGSHELLWEGTHENGASASSGVYFVRVTFAGESGLKEVATRRMMLLK